MRTALKLHAVLVVGSSGGLGHLQSLEQPLLRPVRRPVESTLNSTRWHPPSEREAGAAGTVMLCRGADKGRIDTAGQQMGEWELADGVEERVIYCSPHDWMHF